MALVVVRVLANEIGSDSRHLFLRLDDCHARSQPPDSHQPLLAASFEASEIVAVGVGSQRYPQAVAVDAMTIESRSRDADHRKGSTIQPDRSSDDVSIGVELRCARAGH